MNNIKRKLRSKVGASMILALMFLLFCSFVGGSVLVSATANAYRVAHLQEQQDFLNQRSAALLLAEEMRLTSGQYLRIKVIDEDIHMQEMKWTDEGARQAEPTASHRSYDERIITFRVESNGQISEMQRLMLEMTMWRYLVAEAKKVNAATRFTVEVDNLVTANSGGEVQLSEFYYSLMPTSSNRITVDPATVSAIECELSVSAQWLGNVSGIATPPQFITRCSSGSGTDIYDFFVDVGEDSVMKLALESIFGTTVVKNNLTGDPEAGSVPGLTAAPGYPLTGLRQVTETKIESVIYWQDPEIEKGGA